LTAPRIDPAHADPTALRQLRVVALLEGVSFLILLLVAMPLKYLAHLPMAVRIVGMIHGMLFLAFLAALLHAATTHEWSRQRAFLALVAALVPFGTFVLDRALRREIAELQAA
jgi:integral membrane protein